jgi:hypothetical protein
MTNEKAIEILKEYIECNGMDVMPTNEDVEAFELAIKAVETLSEPKFGKWVPIETRPLTKEERQEFAKYWCVDYEDTAEEFAFACRMPDDGQEILISTEWGVTIDICIFDDGYGLETRGDWDGVTAWMPLPEAYNEEEGKS